MSDDETKYATFTKEWAVKVDGGKVGDLVVAKRLDGKEQRLRLLLEMKPGTFAFEKVRP